MGAKDPGQAQAYNNCGYYLLGRVVAKKRGKAARSTRSRTTCSILYTSTASGARPA